MTEIKSETINDLNTLIFFDRHYKALNLYQSFEGFLYEAFPGIKKRIRKTHIAFYNKQVFVSVSYEQDNLEKELPEGAIIITFVLPSPLESDRVAVRTESAPGRWTHRIVISRPEELDQEMLSWIRTAYLSA